MLFKFAKQSMWLFGLALLFIQQGMAQNVLVEINNIVPEEIKYAGFILNEEQEINIDAIGAHRQSRHWISSTAWILNADTREIAWELTDANSKWKSRQLREYRDAVTLSPGRYEVYYCYYPSYYKDEGWSITKFFFGEKNEDNGAYADYKITVYGNGKKLDAREVEEYQKKVKAKARFP